MKIKILREASDDLTAGFHFYEGQSPGIGRYFVRTLFADIDSLSLYAGIHPRYFGDYHRMLSKKFPYAVYYRVESEVVVVYAVIDNRRNPAELKERLK